MKYLDKEGLKELVRRIKQIKEIIISDSQPTGEDVSCWVDTSEEGNDIIIQESGSNENGNWIKFYDGTMICYGEVNASANSASVTATLPNTFIDKNYVVVAMNSYANSPAIFWSGGAITTNAIALYPREVSGNIITNLERCRYIAIGKWK